MLFGLKNYLKKHLEKWKARNFVVECKINESFILMNPNEIHDFISEEEGFIDLINLSFIYIKKYFPDSVIYLEFREDPEFREFDAIFAYIYSKTKTNKENRIIFDDLSDDFDNVQKKYGDIEYILSLISGDEYFRNRLKN